MSWTDNLKQIMNDKGVNIEQLKNRIVENGHSLSRNSIGNILNERNSPKIETLQIIADALDVKLHELFIGREKVFQREVGEIDGFIDFHDQVYRIKSRDEFKTIYDKIIGREVSVNIESDEKPETDKPQEPVYRGSLLARAKLKPGSNKLQRHIFERYNITISSRKELESAKNLSRDVKIWIFRSINEEKKARSILQKMLKYSFNT